MLAAIHIKVWSRGSGRGPGRRCLEFYDSIRIEASTVFFSHPGLSGPDAPNFFAVNARL